MRTFFAFPKHTHHLLMDGEFILLDEKSDRYIFFNQEESSNLIEGLLEGKMNSVVERCISAKLLTTKTTKQSIRRAKTNRSGIGNHEWRNVGIHRNFRFHLGYRILAILLTTVVKILLQILGLRMTLNIARKLAHRFPRTAPHSARHILILEKIAGAIFWAGTVAPFRIQCLESSISIFFFSIFIGIQAKLKIGVQRYDFLAHAWIQIGDLIIGDSQSLDTRMPVILEI